MHILFVVKVFALRDQLLTVFSLYLFLHIAAVKHECPEYELRPVHVKIRSEHINVFYFVKYVGVMQNFESVVKVLNCCVRLVLDDDVICKFVYFFDLLLFMPVVKLSKQFVHKVGFGWMLQFLIKNPVLSIGNI